MVRIRHFDIRILRIISKRTAYSVIVRNQILPICRLSDIQGKGRVYSTYGIRLYYILYDQIYFLSRVGKIMTEKQIYPLYILSI